MLRDLAMRCDQRATRVVGAELGAVGVELPGHRFDLGSELRRLTRERQRSLEIFARALAIAQRTVAQARCAQEQSQLGGVVVALGPPAVVYDEQLFAASR